jgi:uncharacterized membrane protein
MFLDLVMRWVHVGTAIVVLGGAIFLRFVLMPAAQAVLADDVHQKLRERLMATWKRVVHAGIALFLLSGLYNYLVVMAPQHQGDGRYHMLLGIKILLALAVFFLSSALVGRAAAFEGLRKNARVWLAVNIALALVIVAISGFLKIRGLPLTVSAPANADVGVGSE